ncbi:MAG: DUF433 domain-containing protein [Bacteroidetes bacterium]|nr:DUF433 domain-containing protein [Bacteroidota bacterium]
MNRNINKYERIEVNPNVHFGKPCITGTRIPVTNVLELLHEGISFKEIMHDHYPDIKKKDIQACVQYAIDFLNLEK